MDLLSKEYVCGALKYDRMFLLKLFLSGLFTALGVYEMGFNLELSFVALIFVPAAGLFFTYLKMEANSNIVRLISILITAVIFGLLIKSVFLGLGFFLMLEGATSKEAVTRYKDARWIRIMQTESSRDEPGNLVSGHTLFSSLPEGIRKNLTEQCSVMELDPGAILIKQGEFNHYLFLIAKGEVDVIRGKEVITTMHAGDIVGEVSVSGLGLPVADVVAKNNVLAFAFPVDVINEAAATHPPFAKKMHETGMRHVK
jgi:hypothetical protein